MFILFVFIGLFILWAPYFFIGRFIGKAMMKVLDND